MKFKFWDVDESYFIFAPVIVYDITMSSISIGCELFGCRVFYLALKRSK